MLFQLFKKKIQLLLFSETIQTKAHQILIILLTPSTKLPKPINWQIKANLQTAKVEYWTIGIYSNKTHKEKPIPKTMLLVNKPTHTKQIILLRRTTCACLIVWRVNKVFQDMEDSVLIKINVILVNNSRQEILNQMVKTICKFMFNSHLQLKNKKKLVVFLVNKIVLEK